MFKTGDRVVYVGTEGEYGFGHLTGREGVVDERRRDATAGPLVGVSFSGRPYMIYERNLRLVQEVKPEEQAVPAQHGPLPEDSAERKTYPLMRGLFDYFPSALAAVAHHSYLGNEKHNPGQEIHHARGKSPDHLDAALRHIMERDLEGAAWRILAALQQKYEDEGHPVAPGARFDAE
jgi:hypothetical protein